MLIPFLFVAVFAPAETGDPVDIDPSACLGFDLTSVFLECGVPSTVFPVRGSEAWQDDVVFRYGTDYSLFLFHDRVWQVRVWDSGHIAGIAIGDSRESVIETLGDPAGEIEGSLVFDLPDRGYPVRLRVNFSEDAASDLYLYRADF